MKEAQNYLLCIRRYLSLLTILIIVVGQVQFIAGAEASTLYPQLVSQSNSGEPADPLLTSDCGYGTATQVSDDGRYIAFCSDSPNMDERGDNVSEHGRILSIYVRDTALGTTKLVSVNNDDIRVDRDVYYMRLSGDGTKIYFTTWATNIDSRATLGSQLCGYIRDLSTQSTYMVSVDTNGSPLCSGNLRGDISYDGSYVVFSGGVRNVASGTTLNLQSKFTYGSGQKISGNGRYVLYEGPQGARLFDSLTLEDRLLSADLQDYPNLTLLAYDSGGRSLSYDGRYAMLLTADMRIKGAYGMALLRYDVVQKTFEIAGVDAISEEVNYNSDISADATRALIPFGYNMYVYDFNDHSTTVVPLTRSGQQIDRAGEGAKCDGTCTVISFLSGGTNIGVLTTPSYQVYMTRSDYMPPADQTGPSLSGLSWSVNPKQIGETSSISVSASDDTSTITQAEYFIGDTDPGQGNGATMTLTNVQNGGLSADLTTTFGTDFPTGVYKISVRAQDAAGNWSDPISDYLVVYDPAGPKMTGKRTIIPSLANGDTLPGLIAGDQADKARFAFSVKYNNQGQINANSDLQFSYSTGTRCNNPNNAQNCHTLTLNATSIAWLTTQGDNNSTGVFQGVATMVVDGQTSTVLFRVTGVDGERLSPTAADRFQIQVFNQDDNPNTATPLYLVNSANIARGNIKLQ